MGFRLHIVPYDSRCQTARFVVRRDGSTNIDRIRYDTTFEMPIDYYEPELL